MNFMRNTLSVRIVERDERAMNKQDTVEYDPMWAPYQKDDGSTGYSYEGPTDDEVCFACQTGPS